MAYRNKEKQKKHDKDYYQKNREYLNKKSLETRKKKFEALSDEEKLKFKEKRKLERKLYYEKNKERMQAKGKIWRENFSLKNKYGISNEDYWNIFKDQNGKCAICGLENSEKSFKPGKLPLVVDHCHITNIVRGLLCHNCNILLGHSYENLDILKNSIKYLENGKTKSSSL